MEVTDDYEIEELLARVEKQGGGLRTLLLECVKSDVFAIVDSIWFLKSALVSKLPPGASPGRILPVVPHGHFIFGQFTSRCAGSAAEIVRRPPILFNQ